MRGTNDQSERENRSYFSGSAPEKLITKAGNFKKMTENEESR